MWSDIPNLRHLRAFCVVADCHSISQAAQRIAMSQPAITQALVKLEQALEVKLFDRSPDGMRVTAPGRLFHARVTRALELLSLGAREIGRMEQRKKNRGFTHFDQLLTVTQLRALSAMARTANFSLAARKIGVSQPSIHRAARDLERLTGMALYIKTERGIELSRAAQILVQHAELAFAELQQGYFEIAEWLGLDSGSIRIGSMPLARSQILPDAIIALTQQKPQMRVRVIDAPYDDLLYMLRHGELDLMIGALRDPPPIGDVVQEALFTDTLHIAARKNHPLTLKTEVSRGELLSYPWIVPPEGTPTRTYFNAMFTPQERSALPGMIEASSLLVARGVMTGSDRLTIISQNQVVNEYRLGLLAPVPFPMPNSGRPIGLTLRSEWRPTASQALCLDILRDQGKHLGSLADLSSKSKILI